MNQFIEKLKKELNVKKIAYTARLDPMARGVVPILINDQCKQLDIMTKKNKIYSVKIIVGISTDSDDILGIIGNIDQNISYKKVIKDKLKQIYGLLPMQLHQKYHYYSTKQLIARRRNDSTQYYNDVCLYDLDIIYEGKIPKNVFIDYVINIINKVDNRCDFRQNEITSMWDIYREKINDVEFIEVELDVSNGFFVRQFINDICKDIGIPLMCFQITRIFIY